MSDPRFSIIPAGAVLDPNVEPRDLQVLCLFGRHIDKAGWCRRSQVLMAKEMGCARSTVQASIERLVAAGWLHKRAEREPGEPGGRTAAYEYRVVLDVPDQTQDVVSDPADQSAPPADPERHPLPMQASAPKLLTSPINGKSARTRLAPTEGLVVVPLESPDFRSIEKLRGKKLGYLAERSGTITVSTSEFAEAQARFGDMGQGRAA